jgi:glutamate decarboxylase
VIARTPPSRRSRKSQLPAYTFPKNRTDLAALRVVVRRGVTHDPADLLIADYKRELALLEKQSAAVHASDNSTSFHH